MGIGYMTCENDGKYVSNAKLKQLICDRIFLGGKKYFFPTKILTYFEFHRNNIWNQDNYLKSENIQNFEIMKISEN